MAGRYDVLHVHYGLMAYYAWAGRRPFVLHLHGSDVRDNLAGGPPRLVVRWGLRHARKVYFSTPDLAEPARAERPDAEWLPAPIGAQLLEAARRRLDSAANEGGEPLRVLLCSRWDPAKGTDALLRIAADLRARDSSLEIIGLDWGDERESARAAGIRLVPRMPHDSFFEFLDGFDLAVGQMAVGAPGVTELECMARGVPVVMRFDYASAYEEPPPIVAANENVAANTVLALLHHQTHRAEVARAGLEWVLRYPSAEALARRLAEDYAAVRAAEASTT